MNALALRRDDRLACKSWIKTHSKSFFLSSMLLPERVRQASWALYAFCRRADDAVDTAGDGMARVDALRRRLDSVYRGDQQSDPIDRAFQQIVDDYAIMRSLPDQLLLGMEMDARGTRTETWDELYRYCFRVASTVGLMMTRIMGISADVAYLRAADLGVAMQLTNIARDVGEDARLGRVYLPEIDRESVLRAREATPEIRAAVKSLLERAEGHYRAADQGVPLLPRGCRFAIASSRLIYSRIGAAVARNGYDSVTTRAYVSLPGKLALLPVAALALFRRAKPVEGPGDAILRKLLGEVGLPC